MEHLLFPIVLSFCLGKPVAEFHRSGRYDRRLLKIGFSYSHKLLKKGTSLASLYSNGKQASFV